MIARSIPASVEADLERSSSPDALLAFMTITHSAMSEPIRVVSDVFDYVKGGFTYTGIVFGFRILNDQDNLPEAEIRVANVDRRIGQALRASNERANLALEICSSSEFDLSVEPRTEIATAANVYAFQQYELADVNVDAAELRGRVILRDYAQEPWPYVRATHRFCPGLFR